MNTFTAVLVAALCLTGALASPVANAEVAESSRTTVNSNNLGFNLALNSTTLTIAVVVVVGLFVAVLLAQQTGVLGGLLSEQRQDTNQQYYQQEQPYRAKRSADESKSVCYTIQQYANANNPTFLNEAWFWYCQHM